VSQQYNEILLQIKAGKCKPHYILHGDEPFYIEKLAEAIENHAIPAESRAFNQNVFFGKDLSIGALLNYARSYPMMGGQQVIIVKDAQSISGFGANDRKEEKDNLKLLEQYFLAPQSGTILALCFTDNLDERKTWLKAADKLGVVFKSKKFYDDKLPAWIAEYCHGNNKKISPKAIQLLTDFIGNDLVRVAAELDKLCINLAQNEEITAQAIEKYIGISREYNVFELQKALGRYDVRKANQIILYFAKNTKENPLPVLIAMVFGYFTKILLLHASADKSERTLAPLLGVNPYFVRDYLQAAQKFTYPKTVQIINYIKTADLQSKGIEVGTLSEKDILQDLIFKILH
jgi:DNA polymerase III subunit delta